jgi:aryl-alcohol dehydrogenase-like predicted oxidoreductase/histidinol phosphatase-like enzyme
MRLSTDPERVEAVAAEVLHAAIEAGVDLLDTADSYCLDESDVGHNERMIARALARCGDRRERVHVATKGGLTRPGGRWVADGRARELTRACEASLRALDRACIDLYQLHAPDPKTPLSTSVRALAALQRGGLVRRVGLCNVTVAQIEEARRHVDVASVQVALGPFDDEALRSGVLEYCASRGIALLAHTPLGGPRARARLERDAVLAAVAARHDASAAEVALAWLRSLAPNVVPIPGATRHETARSAVRAASLVLTAEDVSELDGRMPAAVAFRERQRNVGTSASAGASTSTLEDGEVVIIMGYPAAGKTTEVQSFVDRGYVRLNRDLAGGRLVGLAVSLDRALAAGQRRFVLDNTYPSRKSRNPIIDVAARHNVPVRCIWLETSLEQAQVNACERLVARYGALPMPEQLGRLAKQDPNAFAPHAQFRYRRELEPPDLSEGLSAIERRAFERRRDPTRGQRALVVDLDGVVWSSRRGERAPVDADDVEVSPARTAALAARRADGWLVLGVTWQPAIAEGTQSPETLAACIARAQELLGFEIDVVHCPHAGGPPVCWCRKPLPGLGVVLIARHRIDASASVHVGKTPHDRLFAERLGLAYIDHQVFFG